MICLILSPSQNCCHSHCVNKSRARVKCEKREMNYAPCGTIPPRKQQSQGPTNTCRCPCCQKDQLPRGTLHPWLLRDKGHLHILHIKGGARGLLDTPAAPVTQLGHRNCVETKLVSNSSLGRRLTELPLNCYMLLEKTTK